MPSITIESAYLSNYEDENKILNSDFQEKIAYGIVLGVKEYLEKH
jgi:N-acetylmuramoyl-L-alanine amidase